MPEKQVYEYALIRVVPRVERGECLNVGVILFCKSKKYLAMRYHLPTERLHALWPELDIPEINDYLQAWDKVSTGQPDGGPIARLDLPERFRWLTAAKSTVLQCSAVHPGLTLDPARELDALFREYVL